MAFATFLATAESLDALRLEALPFGANYYDDLETRLPWHRTCWPG
jgi:4-hydroxyphenylpyruvate dioxygenase-like putative hemolysin